ncbi:MAG: hypothetical protein ABEI52_08360 [Halobacteriaceae archaeon]
MNGLELYGTLIGIIIGIFALPLLIEYLRGEDLSEHDWSEGSGEDK